MHNVRTKWVRLTAPHLKVPAQLNRARCTPQQARAALAESAARCMEMLDDALSSGRTQEFHSDAWARPMPVGVEMLCYMLSHEAHHRGEPLPVLRLRRQLPAAGEHSPAGGVCGRPWREAGHSKCLWRRPGPPGRRLRL